MSGSLFLDISIAKLLAALLDSGMTCTISLEILIKFWNYLRSRHLRRNASTHMQERHCRDH